MDVDGQVLARARVVEERRREHDVDVPGHQDAGAQRRAGVAGHRAVQHGLHVDVEVAGERLAATEVVERARGEVDAHGRPRTASPAGHRARIGAELHALDQHGPGDALQGEVGGIVDLLEAHARGAAPPREDVVAVADGGRVVRRRGEGDLGDRRCGQRRERHQEKSPLHGRTRVRGGGVWAEGVRATTEGTIPAGEGRQTVELM